jgi:hypothetical protein
MPDDVRHFRARSLALLALASLALMACESDATNPVDGTRLEAELVAPGPVSAAVIDVTGATRVEVVGGDAFTQTDGVTLRAIIILFEPGDLDMTLLLDGSGVTATATLVDVADGDGTGPASLEGYRVELGS